MSNAELLKVRNQRTHVSVKSRESRTIYMPTSQETGTADLHNRVSTEDIHVDLV
jgi:hypothetical protein